MGKTNLFEEAICGEVTEIDVLNFTSSAIPYKEYIGKDPFEVRGMAITKVADEDTGELRNASYIVGNGIIIGGVSSVATKSVVDAMGAFDRGVRFKVSVDKGTSKGERDFCRLVFYA